MTWAYTKPLQWQFAEEPTKYDTHPVDANTLIYEGCPVGANSGSSPANCARPCVAADAFLGFALRSVDNTTTGAATPNILNFPNTGTGLAQGAYVDVISSGRIRMVKSVTPDTSGTVGNGITGLAGTQADINTKVYYNGTGFTNSSGGNTQVGVVVEVGTTNAGGVYWDLEIQSSIQRNA